MNKNSIATFLASGDVVNIDITVLKADVNIVSTPQPRLGIAYGKGLQPVITERDGRITLQQGRSAFSKLRHPVLTISVPECNVPDVKISAERGKVTISGGIFGDACVKGKNICARIDRAAFENLQLQADELDMAADDITVRNLANARAFEGRVMFDNAFCKRADCHVIKGNIGMLGSECDSAILNSDEGNISALLPGMESDYTLMVSGASLSGRPEGKTSGGKCLRARAAKGCVLVDFENAPRVEGRGELLGGALNAGKVNA